MNSVVKDSTSMKHVKYLKMSVGVYGHMITSQNVFAVNVQLKLSKRKLKAFTLKYV